MKVTGLILMMIGLIAGAICLMQIVQPHGPDRDGPVVSDYTTVITAPVIGAVLSGAAIVVGLLMVLFGGRGYIISYNPKVRN